jgi:polyhydroxyalkanoate depolymerase
VLAAVAIMAEDADPAQPRSMTLMAGPIDTRVNPTKVNRLATSRSIEWFERNLIGFVPLRYPGAWRRVYPGFLQLAAFMSMNLDRHVKAQVELFCHLANGDDEQAAGIQAFYDEYCAVMDLPAEFYLQTVRTVFQEHALPLCDARSRSFLTAWLGVIRLTSRSRASPDKETRLLCMRLVTGDPAQSRHLHTVRRVAPSSGGHAV